MEGSRGRERTCKEQRHSNKFYEGKNQGEEGVYYEKGLIVDFRCGSCLKHRAVAIRWADFDRISAWCLELKTQVGGGPEIQVCCCLFLSIGVRPVSNPEIDTKSAELVCKKHNTWPPKNTICRMP